MADPADRALEQIARALAALRLPETQRIKYSDRPRAEREDVAQDAADAGRRTLERLDRAGVVMRLDLERAGQPAARIDRAGVLARAHQHRRPLGRQRHQQLLGVLVGAVLTPQQREHRQLDLVRLAAELLDHEVVLGRRQTQRDRVRARRERGLRHGLLRRSAPSIRRSAVRPLTRSARRPRARGAASGRRRCRPRCARPRCRAESR